MRPLILSLCTLVLAGPALAATLEVKTETITEWKPVYGQVETRDRVPARARIGGTISSLLVTEGDRVEAGAQLALIEDDKLLFRIDALDAQLDALRARLATAQTDLERGEQLLDRGVITVQRVDQLRTEVDVLHSQISSLDAERLVISQQIAEGAVLSPESGVVLSVPVALGSVIGPGESIAEIGGGGAYLRLAVPERFAADLAEGDRIEIGGETAGAPAVGSGELVKLYPLIAGGRVQADVEIPDLDARFVGRRVPVRLPVAQRAAILIPDSAIETRGGLDFVAVETANGNIKRAIVPGPAHDRGGSVWREILSGLAAGDKVIIENE